MTVHIHASAKDGSSLKEREEKSGGQWGPWMQLTHKGPFLVLL